MPQIISTTPKVDAELKSILHAMQEIFAANQRQVMPQHQPADFGGLIAAIEKLIPKREEEQWTMTVTERDRNGDIQQCTFTKG